MEESRKRQEELAEQEIRKKEVRKPRRKRNTTVEKVTDIMSFWRSKDSETGEGGEGEVRNRKRKNSGTVDQPRCVEMSAAKRKLSGNAAAAVTGMESERKNYFTNHISPSSAATVGEGPGVQVTALGHNLVRGRVTALGTGADNSASQN